MVWPNPYEKNVTEDFSSKNEYANSWNSPRGRGSVYLSSAPTVDRFLAVFLDVLFFLPLNGLVFSLLFKKIETTYYHSPQSTEFMVLLGFAFIGILFLVILSRTILQYYLQATPGQYLLKLRVVNYPDQQNHYKIDINNFNLFKPSFYQLLLRNTIWCVQILMLLFPFLEVISHKERRAMHDRSSETWMVSLKAENETSPHPLEQHFVKQFFLLSAIVIMFWGSLSISFLYSKVINGEFKQQELEKDNYLCSAVSDTLNKKSIRIDKAIALFLSGQISETCLLNEADFLLWQAGLNAQDLKKSWAYLAKQILAKDTKLKSSYIEKICEQSEMSNTKKEICYLSNIVFKMETNINDNETINSYLKEQKINTLKIHVFNDTETGIVLGAQYSLINQDAKELQQQIEKLAAFNGFESYLQKLHMQLYWIGDQKDQARGAYQIAAYTWPEKLRLESSSWLCEQEVQKNCHGISSGSCYDWSVLNKSTSLVKTAAEKKSENNLMTLDQNSIRWHNLDKRINYCVGYLKKQDRLPASIKSIQTGEDKKNKNIYNSRGQ